MKRYWTFAVLLALSFLAVFLLFELIDPAVLTDPYTLMGVGGIGAALTGVGLLIADIVLPVPSSLIMFANGALFGIVTGAVLSTIGSVSATLLGFWMGRRGEPVLARNLAPAERARANRMLERWGALAVIVTRPIPILAEATAIMAGASSMRLRSMVVAAVVGSAPIGLLYAVAGATAARWDAVLLAFGLALLIAAVFWFVGRLLDRRHPAPTTEL